ncbi:hypothetical protein ACFFLZ_00835 [Photobacterium aphoticum]|uniref:Uncharacterized protein n=1 Tax=Photobacterium aphoticum TaxID=754436 RepID=A0A0J1JE37_9GAMM|nr:hypothetical protein ABT58_15125 [Photobacterium aphoticum]PSU59604.1 hypothetical protein C9I90_03275 [Photobacterium aphoticum]
MFNRRKRQRTFPLDFYGEEGSWRFIIRAEKPSEVLDAMYWRAYISCHRKDFDLLHMATDKFNYKYNYSSAEASDLHYATAGAPLRVNMMGPIVPISAILAKIHEQSEQDEVSSDSIPVIGTAHS